MKLDSLMVAGLIGTVIFGLLAFNIVTVPAQVSGSPMWNGLTLAMDKLSGASPTTIINFMKAHGFNAIRVYTGWGNGKQVTGSFYSGNINAPLGTWARSWLTDLFAQATANEFLLVMSIADQYTSLSTDYPEEVQHGWSGGTSSSGNWMDVKGPNFITMERNLVREVVEIMKATSVTSLIDGETISMIPWVQIDEITYTIADGGPAFYATPMKSAYQAATGQTAPQITGSEGSYDNLNTAQKQYFDYVRNAIADFYKIMAAEAVAVTSSCRFGAMIDYVWNLNWYLRDVEPFTYFGTLNNLVAEWFYGIQNQIWTGTRSLPDCYNKIWDLNPLAYHYFNYGRITYSNGEATIRRLIGELRTKGYDGGFLYEYADIRTGWESLNLVDATGPKPDYTSQPPPQGQFTLTVYATTGGTTNLGLGVFTYDNGTVVTVTAIPNTGYSLDSWEVDGLNVGSPPSYTFTMNANHVIKAYFVSSIPPVHASFTWTPNAPTVGETVTFDASASTGTIVSYFWVFGDGGAGSGQKPTHSYSTAKQYTVTLTVSSGTVTDSITAIISVVTVPPQYSTVTLWIDGSGTIVPAAGTYTNTYLVNSSITVTATPATGWQFDHWLRNGNSASDNPHTFTSLQASENIYAVFVEAPSPPPPTTPPWSLFGMFGSLALVGYSVVRKKKS